VSLETDELTEDVDCTMRYCMISLYTIIFVLSNKFQNVGRTIYHVRSKSEVNVHFCDKPWR